MDRINELLSRLTSLSAEERAELDSLIAELSTEDLETILPALAEAFEAAAADPEVSVEALGVFGDIREAIDGEIETRATAEAERTAAIEAQRARLSIVPDAQAEGETAPEGEAEGETAPEGEAEGETAPEAVAAAATPPARPSFAAVRAARPAPAAREPETQGYQLRRTLVAAADLRDPLQSESGRLRTVADLRRAWAARIADLSGFDGQGQFRVATMRSEYPDFLRLDPNLEPRLTTRRIAQALSQLGGRDGQPLVASGAGEGGDINLGDVLTALAAAGGLVAPVTPYYDELDISVADRPVADGLVSFQTDRGGIIYQPPIQLAAMAAGVGKWTVANDTAATAGTPTKNIVRIAGGNNVTVQIRAVTARALIGNLLARTDPELVEDGLSKLMAAWAREAENDILADLSSLSTDYFTTDHYLGYTRDFLGAVLEAAAGYRQKHRMARNATLEIHGLPVYAMDAMKADLARQLATDSATDNGGALNVSDAQLEAFLASKHVVLKTPTLDGATAQQFAQAKSGYTPGTSGSPIKLPRFPTVARWWLCAPGTIVRLDGGELNIGVIRDTATSAVNDFQTFYEAFEAVANLGVDLWQIDSTLVPDGASASTVAAGNYDALTAVSPAAGNNG